MSMQQATLTLYVLFFKRQVLYTGVTNRGTRKIEFSVWYAGKNGIWSYRLECLWAYGISYIHQK